MKKYLILLFYLCVTIVRAQVIFQKTFGGSYSARTSVLQTPDHGYIVLGRDSIFSSLIKLDSIGNLSWGKNYDVVPNSPLIQTFNSGFAFVAGLNRILMLDNSGNLLWTKSYVAGSNYLTELRSIQQTNDGGFIITGNMDDMSPSHYDIYLLKIDSLGNEVWSKRYGGGTFAERGMFAKQNTDNGYIIYATQDVSNTLLIRTDSIGDEIWSSEYALTAQETNDNKIYQTPDSGFVLSANINSKPALVKLKSDGTLMWCKTYTHEDSDNCPGLEMTSDGGYILSGYTWAWLSSYAYTYLIKTNSVGDTLWTRIMGDSIQQGNMSVKQTNDGGYILGGARGDSTAEISIIKTDANGFVSCLMLDGLTTVDTESVNIYGGVPENAVATAISSFNISVSNTGVTNTICTSIGIEEPFNWSFSISPNPTSSTFTITSTTQLQNAQIEIYNLLGEEMYVSPFNPPKAETKPISVLDWCAGIYFVKVQSENGSAVRKLVVE